MSVRTVSGMAVTVTLVFSDEAHREAWLEQEGIIPEKTRNAQPIREIARRHDYEDRKRNTDLTYVVGPVEKKT